MKRKTIWALYEKYSKRSYTPALILTHVPNENS